MQTRVRSINMRYWGSSSLEKPQNPAYFLYYEADTKLTYIWDGSGWELLTGAL